MVPASRARRQSSAAAEAGEQDAGALLVRLVVSLAAPRGVGLALEQGNAADAGQQRRHEHRRAAREGFDDLAGLHLPADGGTVRVDDSRLLDAVGRAVHAANEQVARSEQVRRFALLLADLSEGGGIVTPTMKLKRAAFTARVRHIVDDLYVDARGQR